MTFKEGDRVHFTNPDGIRMEGTFVGYRAGGDTRDTWVEFDMYSKHENPRSAIWETLLRHSYIAADHDLQEIW